MGVLSKTIIILGVGVITLGLAGTEFLATAIATDQADGTPHALSPAEIAIAEAEIDEVRAKYERAVAAQDFAALGRIIYEDTFFVPPGGADWQAMLAAGKGSPFPPGFRIDITPRELVIINAEWAYEFGSSVASYIPGEGADPVSVRDTYLILLRNKGNGWKPYREVASSSPPPGGWLVE